MKVSPIIIGSGMAGQAIAKALQVLSVLEPELELSPIRWHQRDKSLQETITDLPAPLILIANPPGLHADLILEADRLCVAGIMTEKPVATTMEQVDALKKTRSKVAVFHGYRQMWGPQTLRELMAQEGIGELISLEGRYWQSSVAHRAIYPEQTGRHTGWKSDVRLSGPTDILLDLGTHWLDLVKFVLGDDPTAASGWISYLNAEAPHRDTHFHLTTMQRNGARTFGSISKTVHGATNGLELVVLGTKRSLKWNFMAPDEIEIGEGRDRRILTRKTSTLGSLQPAFHGLGWLEGYVEILRQYLKELRGEKFTAYPNLREALETTSLLLSTPFEGQR